MIGGLLGRKHDGDPRWITMWRRVKGFMLLRKAGKLLRTQEQAQRRGQYEGLGHAVQPEAVGIAWTA